MKIGATFRRKLKKARTTVFTILLLSILLFFVISALAIWNEGLGQFLSTLTSLNFFYYALALVCVFLSSLVGFPKWSLFVHKLGLKVSLKKNFAVYMSMFSMDITPGRWGRAVVALTLNRITGKAFGKTFPAVVADILTDFLGFIGVVLVSSFLVKRYLGLSIIISILLIIPFIFIYVKPPYDWVKKKLKRFKRLKVVFDTADQYWKSSRSLTLGSYVYAMAFTIPSVFLISMSLYFVILSFGINLNVTLIPTIMFIYTSSLLIGMVTGIPGTLGVTDAAMISYLIAFLSSLGVTFGVASVITIFYRIASLWFTEAVSTLFLIYTFRYWK